MQQLIKVKDHASLARDASNQAVINTNKGAWRSFKERRRRDKEKEERIESLEAQIQELTIAIKLLQKPKTTQKKITTKAGE